MVRVEDVGCWLDGRFLLITARVTGDAATTPRLYFKSSLGAAHSYVEMARAGGGFVGRLPKFRAAASPTSYFVEAVMNDGRRVRTPAISAVVVGDAAACPAGARLATAGPDGAVTVFGLPQGLPPNRSYSGPRIDVDFNSRDLREVLVEMAALGGASVEVDPLVRGRVTLKLKQVRWDQAFDVVAWVNGLEWARDGANLRVFRRTGAPEPR